MNKKAIILVSFVALKFLLQFFLLGPDYDLHRDEFLHLDQANHLAWGYSSVPPLTSWISFLIRLLGNSVFWIKFFPAAFGALTICIVWKTIEMLGGNLFAMILGSVSVLLSALLRIDLLYQPNSFDVLSWTALLFIFLKYFKTKENKWIYIGSIVFAIGFLNKYNILFLLMGFIPALLIAGQKDLLRQRAFYIALFCGLLVISPNLLWQYHHDFPVFRHLKELSDKQLTNVSRVEFLQSQLYFFPGSVWIILLSLYALLFYKPFRNYRAFFWAMIFILTIYVFFKAKSYYAIGLYPTYIALGAVYAGQILSNKWKKYLQPMAILIPVLFFIPIYQVAFPDKSPEYIVLHKNKYEKWGMLRWEDGREHQLPQDFADMLGWKELAEKVDDAYLRLSGQGNTLVLCDNYGQAGAINYYTKQKIRAVSFNADYINWFDLTKGYANLISVTEKENTESELQKIKIFFSKSFLAATVTNRYAREYGTGILVSEGADIDIRELIREEIEKRKRDTGK